MDLTRGSITSFDSFILAKASFHAWCSVQREKEGVLRYICFISGVLLYLSILSCLMGMSIKP
jgi:hypothetical protein